MALVGRMPLDHRIGPKNALAVYLDATLITAHSGEGLATPTYLLTELPGPVVVALLGFCACCVYGRQPWSMRLMVSGIRRQLEIA